MQEIDDRTKKGLEALLMEDYNTAKQEGRLVSHFASCFSIPFEIETFHPVESIALNDFTGDAQSLCANGVVIAAYGYSEGFDDPCVLLIYNHKGVIAFEIFVLTIGRLILWFEGISSWNPIECTAKEKANEGI